MTDKFNPYEKTDQDRTSLFDLSFPGTADDGDSEDEFSAEEIAAAEKAASSRKPVGECDRNGAPGSFDPDHVGSVLKVREPTDAPSVIWTWNRSSMLAVGCAIVEIFPEISPYAERKALRPLAKAGPSHDVDCSYEELKAIAMIRHAAHTLGFDSADIKLPAERFLEPLEDLIGVGPDQGYDNQLYETPPLRFEEGKSYKRYQDAIKATKEAVRQEESAADEQEPEDRYYRNRSRPVIPRGKLEDPYRSQSRPLTPQQMLDRRFTRPDRLERVGHGLSLKEAYRSELNAEELRLLTAIARALQDDLPGWELTESMTKVVELYNASVDKLEDLGYIKSHTVGGKRRYYTATKAGRDEVNTKKKNGPALGDLGDELPHRVGAKLAADVLSRPDDIVFARRFESISEAPHRDPYDVVLEGREKPKALIEVEWTKYPRSAYAAWKLRGTGNEQSLLKDYQKLTAVGPDVTAIWVVTHLGQWAGILELLDRKGVISVDVDPLETFARGSAYSLADANEFLRNNDFPGMERVHTYQTLWREL